MVGKGVVWVGKGILKVAKGGRGGISTSKDARVYYKNVERKKLFRGIRRRVCAAALGDQEEREKRGREEKQAEGEGAGEGYLFRPGQDMRLGECCP